MFSDIMWVLFILFSLFWVSAAAKEIDLLNSLQDISRLKWSTYPETDSEGWLQYSILAEDDRLVTMYGSCDVDLPDTDNWLRTPFLNTYAAKSIYVEIHFIMRECDMKFETRDDRDKLCKNSFNLMYYEADSDLANGTWPAWRENRSYTKLDTIVAHRRYTTSPDWDKDMNIKTFSVSVSRNGVYFALQDKGVCAAIYQLRIYFITCTNTTRNYTHLPDTLTGPSMSSKQVVVGLCVEHATTNMPPKYLCKDDGTWQYLSGTCKCEPGYQPASDPSDQRCVKCPLGTFKSVRANSACPSCPRNSLSLSTQATTCVCKSGYYWAPDVSGNFSCSRLPGSVLDQQAAASSRTP